MNIIKFTALLSLLLSAGSIQSQSKANASGDKAKAETKFTEIVITDSLPSSEILERAVNWVKLETPKYEKTNGVTTAGKAECVAKFNIKPKELNPQCDYTGHITMKVVVEAKDSRYRYTIHQLKHTSKSGKTTGGSIDNVVPECGSMTMNDIQWKKIKGEAAKFASIIIEDLKEAMKKDSKAQTDEW
jgi:hypothetical protein